MTMIPLAIQRCLEKKTYATRREAEAVLGNSPTMRVYKCNICERYHLASKGKRHA
jgi:hypothetical protein